MNAVGSIVRKSLKPLGCPNYQARAEVARLVRWHPGTTTFTIPLGPLFQTPADEEEDGSSRGSLLVFDTPSDVFYILLGVKAFKGGLVVGHEASDPWTLIAHPSSSLVARLLKAYVARFSGSRPPGGTFAEDHEFSGRETSGLGGWTVPMTHLGIHILMQSAVSVVGVRFRALGACTTCLPGELWEAVRVYAWRVHAANGLAAAREGSGLAPLPLFVA